MALEVNKDELASAGDVTTYADIAPALETGDLLAFGGVDPVSALIEAWSQSPVSHVGMVLRTQMLGAAMVFNEIIESTISQYYVGVMQMELTRRLTGYDGSVWWLRMRDEVRAAADWGAYAQFVTTQMWDPYDWLSAGWLGLRKNLNLGQITKAVAFHKAPPAAQQFHGWFCSEFVAAAYSKCGAAPQEAIPADLWPIDLCRWPIWESPVQILGQPQKF